MDKLKMKVKAKMNMKYVAVKIATVALCHVLAHLILAAGGAIVDNARETALTPRKTVMAVVTENDGKNTAADFVKVFAENGAETFDYTPEVIGAAKETADKEYLVNNVRNLLGVCAKGDPKYNDKI